MRVALGRLGGAVFRGYSSPGIFGLLGAVAGLALLVLALSTDRFLTVDNLKAILSSASIVGIMALGLTFVTLIGSLVSLAVGATAVMGAMIFVAELKLGLVPALGIAVVSAALVTALQGAIIGGWQANPVILTIGAAFLINGATDKASGGVVHPTGGGYATLNSTPLGIPLGVFVMVALALLLQYVLRRTVFGRQVMLIGENRLAARAAGIRVTRVTLLAFAIAGAAFALGGAFLGAFNQSASSQLEGTVTFDAIAAVLVGGTLITGGRGSALRTLAGAIVIAAISDVLLLRGFETGAETLFKGALVVAVVVGNHLASGGRESNP
ncbi:MAG TPA: ABC transporter permease [Solirubrobacterales bacterium]|nr:ABC transporter permease [Solirubrobacterales bacterium]